MKRFVAFYGDSYYPGGGAYDHHRSFATLEEACAFAEGVVAKDTLVWAHVWDIETDTIVYRALSQ